jgi:hypothetical protein
MKHVIALTAALFSMLFLMGDSCDSGDFTTSYFFCCDPTGTTCTSNANACPAGGCTTGQQSFANGQNECLILQTDASNNSCALYNRFQQYILIGCTGIYTQVQVSPVIGGTTSPQNLTLTPSPGQIVLNWTAPPALPGPLLYTILRGNATGTEGVLISNVTGTTFTDNVSSGLAFPGVPTFYTVAASMTFQGTIAAPGPVSTEASTTSQ